MKVFIRPSFVLIFCLPLDHDSLRCSSAVSPLFRRPRATAIHACFMTRDCAVLSHTAQWHTDVQSPVA